MERPKKERRMSRSFCPICHQNINTFVIDMMGSWEIRLCKKCAREQGYPIDLSSASKCLQCGELFMKRISNICPVCWIKKFEMEGKNAKEKK
jgi:hypothetical protein